MVRKKIYLATVNSEVKTYGTLMSLHKDLFKSAYSYFALASMLRRNKSFEKDGIKITISDLL